MLSTGVSTTAAEPAAPAVQSADADIDFNYARQLRRKEQAGELLTPQQRQYLDRATAVRQQRQAGVQFPGRPAGGRASFGLVPLSDMPASARYKGQDGGLYGQGRNEPPEAHLAAAVRQAAAIAPLDADGQPAANGKIVLISVGMSNTTQEFSRFVQLANADAQRSAIKLSYAFPGILPSSSVLRLGPQYNVRTFSHRLEPSHDRRVW